MSAIVRETIVSCLINAALSLLFFFLLFGRDGSVMFVASGKFATDFLPQAAAVGFFAAFPPVLIVNNRIRSGKLTGQHSSVFRIMLRALGFAAASLVVFGAAGFFTVGAIGPASASLVQAASIKAAFGIIVSMVVTPLALHVFLKKQLSGI